MRELASFDFLRGQTGFRPAVSVAVVMLLSVPATACGGPSAKERAAKRAVQIEYLARGLTLRERAAASRTRATAYAKCEANIGEFVNALSDLDSRLDVGLTFADYSRRLGDVRVAYNKIDVNSEDLGCLEAGVPAESALNFYSKAHETWNDCIKSLSCDTDSIDPQLQADWAKASPKVSTAVAKLNRIKRAGGPPVGGWTRAVPSSAEAVNHSIYGAASRELCGDAAPVSAVAPCLQLRGVLAAGVSDRELGQLDEAVETLNIAYHFAPAKPS